MTVEIPPNALISVFGNAEISTGQGCWAAGELTFDDGESALQHAYRLFDGDGGADSFERFATSNHEGALPARSQYVHWLGPFAPTPGTRTFSIQYVKSGTSCDATVRDQHLWVLVTKPTS